MRTAGPLESAGGPAPAAAGAPRPRRAPPLRALAELRFRLLARRLRGRGGVPELVARVVLYVIAVPLGLALAVAAGAAAYQAARAGQGLRATVPTTALFFGVFQTWTAVALSLSERDTVDLRRLLVYPLPPWRVYAWGLVASVVGDPFAVFWCLILAGAFVGAAVAAPGPGILLLALVYLLFAAATAAGVSLAQELLARLLRARRARELAVAAVYVAVAALVAWGSGAGARGAWRTLRTLRELRWVFAPPAFASEAAGALYGGRLGAAAAWTAALGATALAAAWLGFRLALADARSGGGEPSGAGAAGGRGWPLPGRLAPLLEKEAKYLLRHPLAAILALVLPVLAAFVGWKVTPLIPEEAGDVVRALPLLGFTLYAHLATQVFWLNAFGWDRGGARLWFLAPVPPADVVLAKNLVAYGLSFALFASCAGALLALAGAPPPWALVGAVILHAGSAPWLLGAGNLVSVMNPRAATHTVQRGARLAPASGLAGMAIVSTVVGLFAAPVLLALKLEEPWVLVGGWALLGLAGLALYRWTLPRVAALLAARREPLIAAVAGDDE